MKTYTKEEVIQQLRNSSDWIFKENSIERNFEFKDFNEASGFLTRVALLSETLNHHAEYSGVYNKVTLRLTTHDSGGVTEKDLKMAKTIDSFVR